jgi:hypothetical protein
VPGQQKRADGIKHKPEVERNGYAVGGRGIA